MYLPHIFTSGRTHHTATEKPLHTHTAIKIGLYTTQVSLSLHAGYTPAVYSGRYWAATSLSATRRIQSVRSPAIHCVHGHRPQTPVRVYACPDRWSSVLQNISNNYQLLRRTYTAANRRPCSSMHNSHSAHRYRRYAVLIRAHRSFDNLQHRYYP